MATTNQDSPAPEVLASGARRAPAKWWTLLAVCGATFMLLVDVTIVQVALPTIQHRLHASFTDLQWIIDAYALTLAVLILAWGSVSDRVGRKRIFVFGVSLFSIASLLCGLAPSAAVLVWSRALQGVGGAAIFATGLALIGQDFAGAERGKAIALWGATVGGGVAVGPLIGGALTSGFGWRWIFIVNVPIGVATVVVARTTMRNVADPDATRLDLAGLATFSTMMFLFIYGVIRAGSDGFSSRPVLALLAGSVLGLGAFIAVEAGQERAMFDLSLFRKAGFSGVCLATFGIGAGMFALLPFLTLYLQNDLGFSPFQGGLRVLPLTVATFVVPIAIRRPSEKVPPGILLGSGLAFAAIGAALLLGISAGSSWTGLIPGLVIGGIGIGIANPAIAKIGLGVVPPARSGMASGISNTFRIGGLATGVAVLGALFQQGIAASLKPELGPAANGLAKVIDAAGVRAAVAGSSSPVHDDRVAFVAGLHEILLVGAVVVAIGAVVAVALVRARDLHAPSGAPEAAPTAIEVG